MLEYTGWCRQGWLWGCAESLAPVANALSVDCMRSLGRDSCMSTMPVATGIHAHAPSPSGCHQDGTACCRAAGMDGHPSGYLVPAEYMSNRSGRCAFHAAAQAILFIGPGILAMSAESMGRMYCLGHRQ